LDISILKFFNQTLSNPAFDFVFKYIGDFNLWAWPLLPALIWLLWKGGARSRWFVLAAVVAIAIIDPSIHYIWKPLFERLRPCKDPALAWVRAIDGCGGRYGFPSSHAANLMGLAVVAGAFYRKTICYLFPLAIIIAISRVYLGVHYPSDVLGGGAYGAAIGVMVALLTRPIWSRANPPMFVQSNP
jgi:undecaprenyl-diphosphatase